MNGVCFRYFLLSFTDKHTHTFPSHMLAPDCSVTLCHKGQTAKAVKVTLYKRSGHTADEGGWKYKQSEERSRLVPSGPSAEV